MYQSDIIIVASNDSSLQSPASGVLSDYVIRVTCCNGEMTNKDTLQ